MLPGDLCMTWCGPCLIVRMARETGSPGDLGSWCLVLPQGSTCWRQMFLHRELRISCYDGSQREPAPKKGKGKNERRRHLRRG